jgi:uncharacterized protein (UPF0333 family)
MSLLLRLRSRVAESADGQTSVEYALLLAAVVLMLVLAVTPVGASFATFVAALADQVAALLAMVVV